MSSSPSKTPTASDQLTSAEFNALAIFASYFVFISALTAFLVYNIYQRYASLPKAALAGVSRQKLVLFSFLAVASVVATWTFMIRFFSHSYLDWLYRTQPVATTGNLVTSLPPLARVLHALGFESLPEQRLKAQMSTLRDAPFSLVLAGRWLVSLSLFRQAWEEACAPAARYWWTQQIFGLTTAWAVFVGWHARRSGIKYAPVFMLLGQLVAVAFSMNLFFLAIVVAPSPPAVSDKVSAMADEMVGHHRHRTLWAAVAATLAAIALLPLTAGTAYYPAALAAPHLLLFLPTLGVRGYSSSVWRIYAVLFAGVLALQALSTLAVAFESDMEGWWAVTAATAAREWESETRLARSLLVAPAALVRAPLAQQLTALAEPLAAPARTALAVLEPNLSRALVAVIDGLGVAARAAVKDPLVVVTWIEDFGKLASATAGRIGPALFEHPAVSSVGLDAVMCWVSAAAWIGVARGAVGWERVWAGVMGEAAA